MEGKWKVFFFLYDPLLKLVDFKWNLNINDQE